MKPLLVVATLSILSVFAGYLIAPIEVRYMESISPSYFWIGLTYAVGALFFSVLSTYSLQYTSRQSFAKIIRVGAFFGVIYPLLYAASSTIFAYMGIKLIWAGSAIVMGPILWTKLQQLLKKEDKPGRIVSNIYAVAAITGAFAQFLGGYLSSAYSITYPYMAMAVVFLIIIFVSLLLPDEERFASETKHNESSLSAISFIKSSPVLLFYYLIHTTAILAWELKFIVWPLIIFANFGSDLFTGISFGSMGVLAFFCLLIIGRFIDRVNILTIGRVALFFLSVSSLLFVFSTSVKALVICSIFYALGEALYGPTRTVFLTRIFPAELRPWLVSFDESFHISATVFFQIIIGLSLTFAQPDMLVIALSLLMMTLTVVTTIFSKQFSAAYNDALHKAGSE